MVLWLLEIPEFDGSDTSTYTISVISPLDQPLGLDSDVPILHRSTLGTDSMAAKLRKLMKTGPALDPTNELRKSVSISKRGFSFGTACFLSFGASAVAQSGQVLHVLATHYRFWGWRRQEQESRRNAISSNLPRLYHSTNPQSGKASSPDCDRDPLLAPFWPVVVLFVIPSDRVTGILRA
jgi:hypothetical protein